MDLFISDSDKIILNEILNKYRNDFDFFAFGSRVKGTNSKYSDLDLCVLSKTNIPMHKLINDFEESNITIKIDIIDYSLVDNTFKKIINSNKVKL